MRREELLTHLKQKENGSVIRRHILCTSRGAGNYDRVRFMRVYMYSSVFASRAGRRRQSTRKPLSTIDSRRTIGLSNRLSRRVVTGDAHSRDITRERQTHRWSTRHRSAKTLIAMPNSVALVVSATAVKRPYVYPPPPLRDCVLINSPCRVIGARGSCKPPRDMYRYTDTSCN